MRIFTSSLLLPSLAGLVFAGEPRFRTVWKSSCPYPVNVHLTLGQHPEFNDKLMFTLNQGDERFDPRRQTRFPEEGVTYKISKGKEGTPIWGAVPLSQFEYKFNSAGEMWYDMSNVDCEGQNEVAKQKGQPYNTAPCPFRPFGMVVEHENCPVIECRPNELKCKRTYNWTTDDKKTLYCDLEKNPGDTVIEFCNYNVIAAGPILRRSRFWDADKLALKKRAYFEVQPAETIEQR